MQNDKRSDHPQQVAEKGSFRTETKYRKVAGEELKEWYQRLWNKGVKENGSHAQ